MLAPQVYLRLFTPLPGKLPLDTISIQPDYDSIIYSSTIPGGFAGLTASLLDPFEAGDGRRWPYLTKLAQSQPYAHVEAWVGAAKAWEGRGIQLDTLGGEPRGFTVNGYSATAAADNPYFSIDSNPRTSGVCLATAFVQAAPLLRVGAGPRWQDPGILHTFATFDGKTPAQIADQIGKEGDGGSLYDINVWDGPRVELVPRLPPSFPDYVLSFDPSVALAALGGSSYGTVIVEYTQNNVKKRTTPLTNRAFQAAFGITRTLLVSAGNLDDTGAEAYAATTLAQVSQPQYRVQIKADQTRGLTSPAGADCPPWLVRAGQWVRVGDIPQLLPITRAEYDTKAGVLTADLGGPPPTWEETMRETIRRAVHFGRGTNPNSGASAA